MTAQNIYDALTRLKRDLSDVSQATFLEWVDYLNKFAYRELIATSPERWIGTQSYTVTSTPSSQSLPADFRSIEPWGCGFYYQDTNGNPTNQRLVRTDYGSMTRGYWLDASSVHFTGINNTETYVLRYIPELAAITALSDTVIIPDEYKEYAVKAADVLYTQWDEDVGAESFADARFVRALDELIRNIRLSPGTYGMADYTQSY